MMNDKVKGRIILFCVYLLAFSVGFWVSRIITGDNGSWGTRFLLQSAVTVAVSVVIIYLGSLMFNNSSVFDPYWSVAPPMMVLFYVAGVLHSAPAIGNQGSVIAHFLISSPRILILFLLTLVYSARLTWNFLRSWPGMHHEDWRYADFRASTGKAYWLVSFAGIHLFPSLMVFAGTLSIWVVVVQGFRHVNMVDLLAILVTGYAILLEAIADRQLRNFLAQSNEAGKTMNQGLWALSRHPNYLGEILFWWGLYLFALAANPSFWWVIAGPLAITLMFIFASIPMIEKRMLKRRIDYSAYQERVSMLVPWRFFGKQVNR